MHRTARGSSTRARTTFGKRAGLHVEPDPSTERARAGRSRQSSGGSLRTVIAIVATVLGSSGHAQPLEFADGCYVRAEPVSPAAGDTSGLTQSHLGLRRKGMRHVEVSVAV